MAITTQFITAFHAKRQNFDWPDDNGEQEAALAKALDYQQAYYPVRAVLTDDETAVFNNALSLLALEMVTAPALRSEPIVKKLKEASSSGASVETEYEPAAADRFPLITAMLAPLAPTDASGSAAVRFSRLRP